MLKKGEKFNKTFKVNSSIYEGFISIFKDENPLHTDEKFATQKGFKGRVMHGNILNGFLSYFVGECLSVKNVIIHSQDIQFKNAVYLDNTLFFVAEIVDVFESVGVCQFKYSFKNEWNKTVAKGKIQIGILG